MPAKILVIEDDPVWSELVSDILTRRGYRVEVVRGADQGFRRAKEGAPDAIVLDVKLAGISGVKLCEYLRAEAETAGIPVLMLTALGDERDKVRGLQAGADDYLAKPFGHEEFAARVMALLRRGKAPQAAARLSAGALALDLDRRELTVEGRAVELRPKEFDLLALFMRNPGRALSHRFLAESAWGGELIVTSQTIAQHVKNLRAKLGKSSEMIETVETVGYRLRAD